MRYSLEGGGERKNESDTFLPPSHLERKGAYFYSARLQSRCKHERMGKVQNTHSMFAKLQICREEERGFLQVVHTLSVTLLPPTEKGFFAHTSGGGGGESPELGVVLKARQKPLDEGRGSVCSGHRRRRGPRGALQPANEAYFAHMELLSPYAKPRHQKQKGFCKTFGESPLAHTLKKFRSEEEGVWASLFCHCSPVVPFAV